MQIDASNEEQVLYNRKSVVVTASWLEIGNTSYAIRYLQKLTLTGSSPPRREAGIVFIISIVMSIWQALRVADDVAPIALNWFLLVLCVVLLIASSYVVFYIQDKYCLYIVLASETEPLQINCSTRADVTDLKNALIQAMDWYRGNPELSAERPLSIKEPS